MGGTVEGETGLPPGAFSRRPEQQGVRTRPEIRTPGGEQGGPGRLGAADPAPTERRLR